jgi:putative two-component system response regulator
MKVLIVDDDPLALDMLRHALQQSGYEVLSAGNGSQAMDILRQGECRLVISDWEMPVMNGIELCRAIRTELFHGYVYVILLTGHNEGERLVNGLAAGADDFMAKPFNPAELTVRLRVGERVASIETRDVAIFALARLAESRDPETGAHLERVREYSRTLATDLAATPAHRHQVDGEFIHLVYLTSPLHDIGKVGIPDSVLLKPGRLSDHEFDIMKTHAAIGAETLDAALAKYPTARFLEIARDIALGHHEHFDGTGYPQGLVGANIPLSARIVALADVYDALSSRRVYKAAFTHDVARSIILEGKGTHFDPDLVDAFIRQEAAILAIRERFADSRQAAA